MADTAILSARATRRQQSANNLEIATFKDGALTYEQHQALPLCAFNRAGLPDVWYLLKLASQHRLSNFLAECGEGGDLVYVVAGNSWYLTPQFYQKAKMVFSMTCKSELGHIGRTSYVLCQTILDSSTGENLVEGRTLLVLFNKSTLRSTPLPGHVLERYSKHSKKEGSLSISVETMPDDRSRVFEYHLRVRASDEDFLYHTNNPSYVRFVLDAATDASMAGKLNKFPGDIAEYEVAKVEWSNKAQSFAGDNLVVYLWEDKVDNLVLHSQVNKENNLITLCKLHFRCPVLGSNL